MKWASRYDRDAVRDAYLKGTPPPQKPHATEERSLPALPKEEEKPQEKPQPIQSPKVHPTPRPAPLEKPAVQRPASPVDRRVLEQSPTSPKSVQSTASVSSPEKLPKAKGSRLGKLFGRKDKHAGPRSTTPLPDPLVRNLSTKDVSAPIQRSTSNTNGNGPSFPAKSPTPGKHGKQSFGTGTSSNEERAAQKAFSNFDAGPLQDMPAFVPEDSPTPSIRNQPTGKEDDGDVSPITPTRSNTMPDTAAPVSAPVVDRWAQIRKNAAERAKRNALEDHTATTATTRDTSVDDGDTSGEESKSRFQIRQNVY